MASRSSTFAAPPVARPPLAHQASGEGGAALPHDFVHPRELAGLPGLVPRDARSPATSSGPACAPRGGSVEDLLRSVSRYEYQPPQGGLARSLKLLSERVTNPELARARDADARKWKTGEHFFVADLRDVRRSSPELFDQTTEKVGRHMQREFHDCDGDYLSSEGGKASHLRRMDSTVPYETTLVTYRVKTSRRTGASRPGVVGVAANREYDNPKMTEYGPAWTGDLVVKPALRGQGHGIRLAAIAAAELDTYPDAQHKTRLYAESHNVGMYQAMGAHVIEQRIIQDDQGEALPVTIMTRSTKDAGEVLRAMGVEPLVGDGERGRG